MESDTNDIFLVSYIKILWAILYIKWFSYLCKILCQMLWSSIQKL